MPIGIVSLLLVQWLVVEPPVLEKERAERLTKGLNVDWLGFVLVALFLGCLEIVLDKGKASSSRTRRLAISASRLRLHDLCGTRGLVKMDRAPARRSALEENQNSIAV